ncbi:MAG: hypothetical protein ABIT38_06775 [Gemmatimonadaceae bacterium]
MPDALECELAYDAAIGVRGGRAAWPLFDDGVVRAVRDQPTGGLPVARPVRDGVCMGLTQWNFLAEFQQAFSSPAPLELHWSGGQSAANCAAFASPYPCRRAGGSKSTETFELGDATTSYFGWKIIIEFENKELPLSNILKFWPYLRGELTTRPTQPILLCHFSDWWSYATRRDLWEWTLSRMLADQDKLVDIVGKQFDHGGPDSSLRASSITRALDWIDTVEREGRAAAV